jgi:hypothetical protein
MYPFCIEDLLDQMLLKEKDCECQRSATDGRVERLTCDEVPWAMMLDAQVSFSSSHVVIRVAKGSVLVRGRQGMCGSAEGEGKFSAYRGFEMR